LDKIDLSALNDFNPIREYKITEYNFRGAPIPFHRVENYPPIFSYKYLSLNGSRYCFDCSDIEKNDYKDLLFVQNQLSRESYSSLGRNFHFHWIRDHKPLQRVRKLFEALIKKYKISEDAIPDFFQFAVSTGPRKSPRVIGFIGKLGIFHLLFFDLDHKISPGPKLFYL